MMHMLCRFKLSEHAHIASYSSYNIFSLVTIKLQIQQYVYIYIYIYIYILAPCSQCSCMHLQLMLLQYSYIVWIIIYRKLCTICIGPGDEYVSVLIKDLLKVPHFAPLNTSCTYVASPVICTSIAIYFYKNEYEPVQLHGVTRTKIQLFAL